MKRTFFSLSVALALATQADAVSIGYFDSSREYFGFSGGTPTPYLSQAKQWLAGQDHMLVSTPTASDSFLAGMDAFYVGLSGPLSAEELAAMTAFVHQGGFLFIQADHGSPWAGSATALLSGFGLSHDVTPRTNSGADYQIVADSPWVGSPLGDSGFKGDAHTRVASTLPEFQSLATGSPGVTVLGVLHPAGSRLGTVFVATDINFWNDTGGWTDDRNQSLWASIWTTAAGAPNPSPVPEAVSTASLLILILLGFAALGRWKRLGSG